MTVFRQLVPIEFDSEERAQALQDLAELHSVLKDQGIVPVVDVEPTPDGDVFTIAYDDPAVAA